MNHADTLQLPVALRRQFSEMERRLWRLDVVIAVCGGIIALAASYALQFLSDRVWDTPAWLRFGFTALGVGAFFYFAWFYGSRWVWGGRTFGQMALLVQRRHGRLGDRLLGIVELADETKRPPNVSAALCAAAIEQVAGEASKIDFQQAVEARKSKKYFWTLVALGALVAAPCVFAPHAGWNALMRWLNPAGHVERYTFVSLETLPDRLVVAHGEPFTVPILLQNQSFWRPAHATAQFENQPSIKAAVSGDHALFQIPAQTQTGFLKIRIGDVSRRVGIVPTYRPELRQFIARIELPAYLQLPKGEEKISSGGITLLKGSRVAFEGKINRALQSASIEISSGRDGSPSRPQASEAGPSQTASDAGGRLGEASLPVRGDTFTSNARDFSSATQLVFRWRDEFGLDAKVPQTLKLRWIEDQPPAVEVRGLAGAVAILEDEVLHFQTESQDDFGVKNLGLRWQVAVRDQPQKDEPRVENRSVKSGDPKAKTLDGDFDFSPKLLKIPGDTEVTLHATATDFFPNRVASESGIYHIYVLSREAHAKLIQEQFEKILAQLEDITRKQEALLQAGQDVREQKPEKLANEKSAQKLQEQSGDQKDLAAQLDKLSKQGAETLREALRNPELSEKTLQEWAENLKNMQELSQGEMQQASQQLSESQQGKSERAPKLDEAIRKEQEILKKLREMQKEGEKGMDKMMTQNFAMRLRKIAGAEHQIAATFEKILPETVGMRANALPARLKGTVGAMAGSQEASRKESGAIQGEISRFFDRTKLERYGDVTREMDESKTDENLTKLTKLIQSNVAVQAMNGAGEWSQKFNDWADRLSQKDDSQSGGSKSEEQMKMMMELFRIRQGEESLRQRTVAVESGKKDPEEHEDRARDLALGQRDLVRAVEKLAGAGELPDKESFIKNMGRIAETGELPLTEPFESIRGAMADAQSHLKKPDTGKPAQDAEIDVINLIDFLLQGDGGGGGGGGGGMAGLMQMMGFGKGGKTPGGNPMGGDTDRANTRVAGTRTGGTPDARAVQKSSGRELQQMPEEFRDALESYFQAIEKP